jgi:hypothetical protein
MDLDCLGGLTNQPSNRIDPDLPFNTNQFNGECLRTLDFLS